MSEMVERVARALWEVELDRQECGWEAASPFRREEYLRDARAAIAAMREPTAAMVEAGGEVEGHVRGEEIAGDPIGERPAQDCWRDMIDEALK